MRGNYKDEEQRNSNLDDIPVQVWRCLEFGGN